MSEKLPLKTDNPNGLRAKYLIKKFAGFGYRKSPFDREEITIKWKNVDPDSEYFVLRLDEHAKDKVHVNACRKAVLYYAELIKDHLPELSKDLIERYSNPV